jgi:hypothetical protein
MRRFNLIISASGTCQNNDVTLYIDSSVIVWTHIAYFMEKVATIGHYNLVSFQHFCRNSLFWTILVKIFALRCTANCSVRSVFKFGIMFCIVKLIRVLSSIFSAHQIPIWQLRIPVYVPYTHMA